MRKGILRDLLLWCTSRVKPHRDPYFLFWLQTCFMLQEVAIWCVVSYFPIHFSRLPFQGLLGEKKCAILYNKSLTCEGCSFWCAMNLLNVLPKASPKSLHDFTTKKGSVPFVYRTLHKKQLIRSVRLLNSAGGVYFVIAAVPMSL